MYCTYGEMQRANLGFAKNTRDTHLISAQALFFNLRSSHEGKKTKCREALLCFGCRAVERKSWAPSDEKSTFGVRSVL